MARDQANFEPPDAEMVEALDEAMDSMADSTLSALETPELHFSTIVASGYPSAL